MALREKCIVKALKKWKYMVPKSHYLKFELRIFFVWRQYVVCFCNENMCNGPEHNKTEAQLKRGN